MTNKQPDAEIVLNHFKQADERFYRLARSFDTAAWQIKIPENEKSRRLALYKIIVKQQLSNRSADAIWSRLEPLLQKDLLIERPDLLHQVGLSRPKAGYLRNLSNLNLDDLAELDADSLRARLLTYKGVGDWTVDMVLIFIFGYPDVFSWADLGLRRSTALFYDTEESDLESLQTRIDRLKPYRSSAARILWHWYDTK